MKNNKAFFDKNGSPRVFFKFILELLESLSKLDVQMLLFNIVSNNTVKRISHFMRNTGIYHFKSVVLGFLVVVEDALRDVYKLQHYFLLVFLVKPL